MNFNKKAAYLMLVAAMGLTGCEGDDGKDGTEGAQGPAGEQGPAGANGTDGSNGSNGSNGANGQDGVAGINEWFINGQKEVVANNDKSMNNDRGAAKNVILFVGDGMGVSTVTAARILEGQLRGESGEENLLSFETMPYLGMSKTYNTNQQTPDSAGTMTAMLTGVKTDAGVIGVAEGVSRGNCESVSGNEMVSALALAEIAGKATGVVSTARITHATPAAAYAISPERNWEDVSDMDQEDLDAGCKDIASQLVSFPYGDGIEVAMGGGRRHFIPRETTGIEGDEGDRTDGVDLTAQWLEQMPNSAYVQTRDQFMSVDVANTDHLLGLFEESHMEWEEDRADDEGGEPSLSEMTSTAIEMLKKDDDGFMLVIESGRIDHAHHAGNASRALSDTIEFANAVRVAMEKTSSSDTLIIVTADHSHVFTIAGYPTRGNPILGLVRGNDGNGLPAATNSTDSNGLVYTTVGYANGPGVGSLGDSTYTDNVRVDLNLYDVESANFRQEATVPMSSETHAAEDVAIYAEGPGAHLLQGTVEQNMIYHVMNYATDLKAMADANTPDDI